MNQSTGHIVIHPCFLLMSLYSMEAAASERDVSHSVSARALRVYDMHWPTSAPGLDPTVQSGHKEYGKGFHSDNWDLCHSCGAFDRARLGLK
jgi:hypothetical protein